MRISDWSSDVCSSDLALDRACAARLADPVRRGDQHLGRAVSGGLLRRSAHRRATRAGGHAGGRVRAGSWHRLIRPRSEEHTSELQSLMRISYAVFCLNKKKNLEEHHHMSKYSELRQIPLRYLVLVEPVEDSV